MSGNLSRRGFISVAASVLVLQNSAIADEFIDLKWNDLLPEGQSAIPSSLLGLVEHDGPSLSSQQPLSTGVRTDWNGKIVRLPGFIIPIEYSGSGVTAFLLAPYVGACVHVPPPPANQLVLVTTDTPYESSGMFESVNVIGTFGTVSITTQLAEVGYVLSAERIAPFS